MDRNLEAKLRAWIDAHYDELIGHLQELVAIPSVATYDDPDTPYGKPCKQVLEEMLKLAESFGLTACNLEDRCGTMTYTPDAAEEINMWCHLDVVPAGEGWLLTEPFKPIIRDGYMIGRGADDNKGPALGVLYILRAMKELGIPFKHGLKLCVGCDEEHGMSDVMYYAANYPAAKLSLIADSGFPVCYGEKGILELNILSKKPLQSVSMIKAGMASNIVPDKAEMHLKGVGSGLQDGEWLKVTEENGETVIRTTGLSRHSAFPEGGVNAIRQMTEAALASGLLCAEDTKVINFFNDINADYLGTAVGAASADEVSGYTTCVGSMSSMMEDGRARIHLNIRYCISADSEAMLDNIRKACEANGCELDLVRDSKPNYFPREAPVVDALTGVFNEMTGMNKEPFVMGGGTYARKLPNAMAFGLGGLPKEETDLFAPGHGGAHQCDEGLHLANLKEALIIFGMALIEADRIL